METIFLQMIQMTNIEKENTALSYWCVLRRVAGWVAEGCWDDFSSLVMKWTSTVTHPATLRKKRSSKSVSYAPNISAFRADFGAEAQCAHLDGAITRHALEALANLCLKKSKSSDRRICLKARWVFCAPK